MSFIKLFTINLVSCVLGYFIQIAIMSGWNLTEADQGLGWFMAMLPFTAPLYISGCAISAFTIRRLSE